MRSSVSGAREGRPFNLNLEKNSSVTDNSDRLSSNRENISSALYLISSRSFNKSSSISYGSDILSSSGENITYKSDNTSSIYDNMSSSKGNITSESDKASSAQDIWSFNDDNITSKSDNAYLNSNRNISSRISSSTIDNSTAKSANNYVPTVNNASVSEESSYNHTLSNSSSKRRIRRFVLEPPDIFKNKDILVKEVNKAIPKEQVVKLQTFYEGRKIVADVNFKSPEKRVSGKTDNGTF